MGWEAAPNQKVSNFVESGLGWSCLHYGFTQFIFNAGGAILERMVRKWMEEDAFDGHCIHPPGSTEHRVIRRADETAS